MPEEIATRLEVGGVPWAAIDLDRLRWFDTGTGDREAATGPRMSSTSSSTT